MYTSQPSSGLIPPFVAFWYSSMAPYMFPWSVRARAFCPSCWQAFTRSLIRFAPSSRLYSLWTWRWQKSGAAMAVVPRGARLRGAPRTGAGGAEPDAGAVPGSASVAPEGTPGEGALVEAMDVRRERRRRQVRIRSERSPWVGAGSPPGRADYGPVENRVRDSRFLRIGIAHEARLVAALMIDSSTSHSRVLAALWAVSVLLP